VRPGVVVGERRFDAALGVPSRALGQHRRVGMVAECVRDAGQTPRPREVEPDEMERDAVLVVADGDRPEDRRLRRRVGQETVVPVRERVPFEDATQSSG